MSEMVETDRRFRDVYANNSY